MSHGSPWLMVFLGQRAYIICLAARGNARRLTTPFAGNRLL
jgi:hypothetical protein